ncbi:reverse transcriptase domain-containing protein [Tanacetum coccineum]|uniref:Reverse transcriptase domain-containing protein n=1 Tax=Tanacetum coccineum TaxID=301880 RepID=A0ABQ5I4C3_9ASTR
MVFSGPIHMTISLEFLAICNMFRFGETHSEAVKLLTFPFSLCNKAKTWFNELNEESITSWEQMRRAFINRLFPPSLFNRLLLGIRNFSQLICENLTDAWLRLKSILRKCHGHGNKDQNSHDSFSHQSLHDPNDSKKSLTELNNDVRNDLEDFKRRKENGVYILQSIDQGPFQLGVTKDTLGTTPKGGVLLGPERARTYDDLNDNEKKRFDADVRATNIVLQRLPKDIYKLINHNIEAKAV